MCPVSLYEFHFRCFLTTATKLNGRHWTTKIHDNSGGKDSSSNHQMKQNKNTIADNFHVSFEQFGNNINI
jgi:hypothetical protein